MKILNVNSADIPTKYILLCQYVIINCTNNMSSNYLTIPIQNYYMCKTKVPMFSFIVNDTEITFHKLFLFNLCVIISYSS